MIRKHLELGELAARTTPVWVISGERVLETTLFEHVMKSLPPHREKDRLGYAYVRDNLFLTDQSRDTMYYLSAKQAFDAAFIAAGQALDR